MKKILLVEDDEALNTALSYDLELENYQVYSTFTIGEGMTLLKRNKVDLALLDGNLPDGDGFAFCKTIKSEWDIPVILLTARDMEQDELLGFDCGADDYITKPFHVPILHRRIQAALRKTGTGKTTMSGPGTAGTETIGARTGAAGAIGKRNLYDDGYLKIDFDALTAARGNETLSMTPTEYKILRLLTANANQVMTKRLLLEKIWDSKGNFVDEHTVAVNINRLRKKIEADGHTYIKTLYGMGYQWKGRS